MHKNSKGFAPIIILAIIILIAAAGFLAYQNTQTKQPPSPTPTANPSEETSPPPTTNTQITSTPEALEHIPTLPTTNWQTVSQNGVVFKIPPEAYCKSDYNASEHATNNCRYIYFYGDDTKIPTEVAIEQYNGGSRREQLLNKYNTYTNCNFIYKEVLFGSVKALQVSGEAGQCYHAGGTAAVIGDKLIMFPDSFYDPDTKEIQRFDKLDTTISTLQPAQ